jgi:hypothetical protein
MGHPLRPTLEASDLALLAAYIALGVLGTSTSALLLNDGAVLLSAGWLGDGWDLYYRQIAGRAVSLMLAYGPSWALHAALGLSASTFILLAHALYFAMPLGLWLAVRAIEPQPIYSRLYLAQALILASFPSEMLAAAGLWMAWAAWIAAPNRTTAGTAIATILFGGALALTHPAALLMSGTLLAARLASRMVGVPVPTRQLAATAAMTVILVVSYLVVSRLLPPSNPTIVVALAHGRLDYADPVRLIAAFTLFPVIPALWALLLLPALPGRGARLGTVASVGVFGVWFAAAGTGLLTWLYARHSAPYVIALALGLAQTAPGEWLRRARVPLLWFSGIGAVAALSYNADIFLFGRYVDRFVKPGFTDVDSINPPWPVPVTDRSGARTWGKWLAGDNYARDVLVPEYDWYRSTLVFYSYFRTNGTGALYHRLDRPGDWLPFECDSLARVTQRPDNAAFVDFLAQRYCVR